MKPLYTLPVLALFTACASTPAPMAETEASPPADIPTVVKKRAAKYVRITQGSVEYALTNSRTGVSHYKEDVNLARFIREDDTTFSLSCPELSKEISRTVLTASLPHTTFKENTDLREQKRQYEIGEIMLGCPALHI